MKCGWCAEPLVFCQSPGRPGTPRSWDVTVTVESERLKLSLEETGTVERRPWSRGSILGVCVATGQGWVTGVQQHTHGAGAQVQL